MDRIASVEDVPERGSHLFVVRDSHGVEQEAILVPCEESGVEGWVNRCTHEAQRLDTGRGAAMRDGQVICPRHGSLFDACDGDCDNGEAAGTRLPSVDVTVENGEVYLDDPGYEYVRDGSLDGDDPGSASHLSF
jgi:nitrite reductase/ring-hydroxylating ferredoxin subunit